MSVGNPTSAFADPLLEFRRGRFTRADQRVHFGQDMPFHIFPGVRAVRRNMTGTGVVAEKQLRCGSYLQTAYIDFRCLDGVGPRGQEKHAFHGPFTGWTHDEQFAPVIQGDPRSWAWFSFREREMNQPSRGFWKVSVAAVSPASTWSSRTRTKLFSTFGSSRPWPDTSRPEQTVRLRRRRDTEPTFAWQRPPVRLLLLGYPELQRIVHSKFSGDMPECWKATEKKNL